MLSPGTTAENLWYNSIVSIVDTHYSRGSLLTSNNPIAHKERTHDAAWVLFTCKEKRDSMIEKVRIDTAEYAVKVVDEFAKGMLNVMRDNPDLLRLISKSQV